MPRKSQTDSGGIGIGPENGYMEEGAFRQRDRGLKGSEERLFEHLGGEQVMNMTRGINGRRTFSGERE